MDWLSEHLSKQGFREEIYEGRTIEEVLSNLGNRALDASTTYITLSHLMPKSDAYRSGLNYVVFIKD